MQKHAKKHAKSGYPSTPKAPKTTRVEKEIIRLISEGITTPERLAVCRSCEPRIIYQHLRNLKDKCILNQFNEIVQYSGVAYTCDPKQQPDQQGGAVKNRIHERMELHQIRIHAHHWIITILRKNQEKYKGNIGKTIYVDNNTVCCWSDKIEVYGTQSFIADDLTKAWAKSMEYWTRLFTKIEHDLKIVLIHDRYQNIKLVRCKYGEMGNEIATDSEYKGERIKIYAREDGNLWFDIDNSFNLREMHTLHRQTGKDDMEKVKHHIDDWRNNDPMNNSEITELITQQAKLNMDTSYYLKETAAATKNILSILSPKEEPKKAEVKSDKIEDVMYG